MLEADEFRREHLVPELDEGRVVRGRGVCLCNRGHGILPGSLKKSGRRKIPCALRPRLEGSWGMSGDFRKTRFAGAFRERQRRARSCPRGHGLLAQTTGWSRVVSSEDGDDRALLAEGRLCGGAAGAQGGRCRRRLPTPSGGAQTFTRRRRSAEAGERPADPYAKLSVSFVTIIHRN